MLSVITISCNKTVHLGSLHTCDGFSKDIRQSIDTESFSVLRYYSCFKAKECSVYAALSHCFFYALISAVDENIGPSTRESLRCSYEWSFPKSQGGYRENVLKISSGAFKDVGLRKCHCHFRLTNQFQNLETSAPPSPSWNKAGIRHRALPYVGTCVC